MFLVSSMKIHLVSMTFSFFQDYQVLPGYQGLSLVPDYLRIFADIIVYIFLISNELTRGRRRRVLIQIKLKSSESS